MLIVGDRIRAAQRQSVSVPLNVAVMLVPVVSAASRSPLRAPPVIFTMALLIWLPEPGASASLSVIALSIPG